MKKTICGGCGDEYDPEFVAEYFTNIKPVDGYCTDKCYFKAKREAKKAIPCSDRVMHNLN